jgi:ATP-binding cassette subfamily F protein uup
METVCNGFIGLLPGGGQQFYATYSQWERESQKKSRNQNSRKPSKSGSASKEKSKPVEAAPTPAKKLSYMDQRDYESIEKRIQEAEAIQEDLQIKMSDPKEAASAGELAKYVTKLELSTKNIEELYKRWDELEAKRNS